MIKKIFLWILLFFITFNCSFILAQDLPKNSGFSVSPPSIEVVINQTDKEKNYILNISNNSNKSEVFKLSVVDFGSLEESAGVAFFGFKKNDLENKYALASWIRLEKDAFVVDSSKTVSIKVAIINRESLSPGGHYGAVVVKMDNETVNGQKLVGVSQSYASLIFVKKTGGEIYKLNLGEANFSSNPIFMADTARLRFQNAGNVHLVPRGKIEIFDSKGRLVSKGILNPDSAIIMPESFRDYATKLNKVDRIFWPGKYLLRVSYRYQGVESFQNYETSFNFLGIWLLSGLLIWWLIIGFLIKAIFRRIKAKKQ